MNRTENSNMSLSFIDRQRIDSLDDTSEEAKTCKIYYDHTRERLLRMFSWGFARRLEKLALREDTVPGWDYCYGYPQECLAVQLVFDEENAAMREMERQEFQVISFTGNDRVIGTNVELAWAEYIGNVKNTEMFSPEFTEALTRMLAASIAYPLTGNTDLQNMNMQLAQQSIDIAMQENVIEREQRTNWPRKYERARFS